MAIERKTVVDQIEITRDGAVQVRLGLLLVEDGMEIDCRYHRTVLDETIDPDATFELVNIHLQGMGLMPLDKTDIDSVKEYLALTATLKQQAAKE